MASRAIRAGALAVALLAGCSTNVYVDGAPVTGGEEPSEAPGGDPATDPGTDPGADPGTDPGADPGTEPGADPGTEPEPDPADPLAADFLELADDFGGLAGRGGSLAPAPDAALPLSGGATYKGVAELTLGSGAEAATLYGEARISADFEDGEVSGDVDHLMGRVGDGPTEEFSGKIDIEEAEGDPGSAGFEATASGALTSDGHAIAFEAPLEGSYLGPDAGAVELWSLPDQGAGSIDGAAVAAALDLRAEQVWRGE